MDARPFAVSVPAEPRYLKVVRAFFQPILEAPFGQEANLLLLALDEACSNVVKHRSKSLMGGLIHVRLEVHPKLLRFRIGDFCGSEEVEKIRPRDLEDIRPGGLGTHFISKIMDRVDFEPEPGAPGRMALVIEKNFPGRVEHHDS